MPDVTAAEMVDVEEEDIEGVTVVDEDGGEVVWSALLGLVAVDDGASVCVLGLEFLPCLRPTASPEPSPIPRARSSKRTSMIQNTFFGSLRIFSFGGWSLVCIWW